MGIWQGLAKTRAFLRQLVKSVNTEELEELLLAADVGVRATAQLVEAVRRSGADPTEALKKEIVKIFSAASKVPLKAVEPPLVIMVVGVNGSGKTTTIGKLCYRFAREGKKVLVAAADTFRDAAAEQVRIWANRSDVELVFSQKGQDAAAVAFDALQKAVREKRDVVLIDTAGRLHTRKDLMAEAVKIKRVCAKVKPDAPEEIWLVLDATVGQNGIRQAMAFHQELGLTGIIMAKLDGTAKGGVLIPVVLELGLPVRFVGVGEGVEDLVPFVPEEYVQALFEG
ncbi:MAG: signal recognition particle-docking protein FtsY [candidate division WOR-3 bacterium]|jgi:fused signal recognition particle receptor|nr:signal recognition particle-docking protein FtsY [candidate division WOR-3 bacterium]MCR4423798.1 signal recognition particle-docking protein FtsY [candidate division WOR-3 bacterium]MDH7519137.1 signal recognition particle-docking protein FtsY [bacterium]